MTFRLLPALLLLGLPATLPAAAATPAAFAETYEVFVETLRARCTGFENGAFAAPEDAVVAAPDFNGDGVADPVIEQSGFGCSSSATLFSGGTGGGAVHVFVSTPGGTYDRFEFLAHGLQVVTPDFRPVRPVLLLAVHAGLCEAAATACFGAYVWSEEGRFISTGGFVTAGE